MMKTGIVSIRDVEDRDLPTFYEHQSDPDAARMAGFSTRARPAFMEHWAKTRADRDNLLQTILVDGQVAGNIVSFWMEGEREVGYWIGREYWGQGITTQALALFLKVETTRPLYAHAILSNTGSIRVLEKCGFRKVREAGEEVILILAGST